MLKYSSTLTGSFPHIMSVIHLSGSEFHPPTNGSVRWRGLESHGLPVGGLDVLKRKVRQIFLSLENCIRLRCEEFIKSCM